MNDVHKYYFIISNLLALIPINTFLILLNTASKPEFIFHYIRFLVITGLAFGKSLSLLISTKISQLITTKQIVKTTCHANNNCKNKRQRNKINKKNQKQNTIKQIEGRHVHVCFIKKKKATTNKTHKKSR